MAAPCHRRMRLDALAHKGKACNTAPQRAKDDESGANWNRPWGKAFLLLTLADPPLAMDGCLAGVPCLYCAQLKMPNYPNIWTGAALVPGRPST